MPIIVSVVVSLFFASMSSADDVPDSDRRTWAEIRKAASDLDSKRIQMLLKQFASSRQDVVPRYELLLEDPTIPLVLNPAATAAGYEGIASVLYPTKTEYFRHSWIATQTIEECWRIGRVQALDMLEWQIRGVYTEQFIASVPPESLKKVRADRTLALDALSKAQHGDSRAASRYWVNVLLAIVATTYSERLDVRGERWTNDSQVTVDEQERVEIRGSRIDANGKITPGMRRVRNGICYDGTTQASPDGPRKKNFAYKYEVRVMDDLMRAASQALYQYGMALRGAPADECATETERLCGWVNYICVRLSEVAHRTSPPDDPLFPPKDTEEFQDVVAEMATKVLHARMIDFAMVLGSQLLDAKDLKNAEIVFNAGQFVIDAQNPMPTRRLRPQLDTLRYGGELGLLLGFQGAMCRLLHSERKNDELIARSTKVLEQYDDFVLGMRFPGHFLQEGDLLLTKDTARTRKEAVTGDDVRLSIAHDASTVIVYLVDALLAQERPSDAIDAAERARARTVVAFSPKDSKSTRGGFISSLRQHPDVGVCYLIFLPRVNHGLQAVRVDGSGHVRGFKIIPSEPLLKLGKRVVDAITRAAQHKLANTDEQTLSQDIANLVIPQEVRQDLAALACRNLVIVPSEELWFVPWSAACQVDGCFSPASISVCTSGSIFHSRNLTSMKTVSIFNPLILGAPLVPASLKLRPLDAAQMEVRSIGLRVHASPYIGCDASESLLKSKASGSTLIHLATHANGSGDDAWIVLAADNDGDGHLKKNEIAALNLGNGLVVLDVCEGAWGSPTTFEGVLGFTRSFQAAGASVVIAPIWRTEDSFSAEFMERFYEYLESNDSATALAETQAYFKNQGHGPFSYAQFQHYGVPIRLHGIAPGQPMIVEKCLRVQRLKRAAPGFLLLLVLLLGCVVAVFSSRWSRKGIRQA